MFRSLIALCVCFLLSSISYAQNGKADDFGSILSQCSQDLRRLVLAEGEPVEFEKVKAQCKDVLIAQVPASVKLTRIAKLCDYSVHRSGEVYLLTKRYSNDSDLPCVTIEEVTAFVRDANALVTSCLPQGTGKQPTNVALSNLLQSLPDRHQQVAETSGLPIASLGATEQVRLQQIVAESFFSTMTNAARSSLLYLEQWEKSRLHERGVPSGVLHVRVMKGSRIVCDVPLLQQSLAQLQPSSALPIDKGLLVNKVATTIEALAAILKQRDASFLCRVSPVIADKPITAGGLPFADSGLVLRSAARLYDLRCERSRGGVWNIGRTPQPQVTTTQSLRNAIWNALPAPFRVVLRLETKDWSDERTRDQPNPKPFLLLMAAHRHLRALLPVVERSGVKGVSLGELSAKARTAYALCVTGDFFMIHMRDAVKRPLPSYLTNFSTHALRYKAGANTEKNLDCALLRPTLTGWSLAWAIQTEEVNWKLSKQRP